MRKSDWTKSSDVSTDTLRLAGRTKQDSVFYCRIVSPVVLIEFDHLNRIALHHEEPSHIHSHTVARTPNGNDCGKDLLRQHYALHHRAGSAAHSA